MCSVDRQTLRSLLLSWQRAEINVIDVHVKAEGIWDRCADWPELPKFHPNSITVEVLALLSGAIVQRLTPQDIPAILRFLNTPEGEELDGWREFEDYWDGVDFDVRDERMKAASTDAEIVRALEGDRSGE